MQLLQQRVNVNGANIHYLESEGSFAPSQSLLFLHGWPLSSGAFRASLEYLASNYHIIAPDLPGFGKSDYVPSLQNYEAYSDWVFDFLKALKINQVNLVGHSMGGGIALMTAYQYPAIVRKLVLLDCAGIPLRHNLTKAILWKLVDLIAQTWEAKFSLNLAPLISATVWNTIFRYPAAWKSLRVPLNQDLRPIFPNIQTPCLILWGENDRTTPLAHGVEISEHIPNAQLSVVENGYHEWSALKPKTLGVLVSDFVE
jgi:pimeloyl-ACP methyl ester carboxylesterase